MEGLKEADGRLDELISYVAPIYIKEKNEDELRKLYKLVMKTGWDTNICLIAKYLYDYAKNSRDYTNQKKCFFYCLIHMTRMK